MTCCKRTWCEEAWVAWRYNRHFHCEHKMHRHPLVYISPHCSCCQFTIFWKCRTCRKLFVTFMWYHHICLQVLLGRKKASSLRMDCTESDLCKLRVHQASFMLRHLRGHHPASWKFGLLSLWLCSREEEPTLKPTSRLVSDKLYSLLINRKIASVLKVCYYSIAHIGHIAPNMT